MNNLLGTFDTLSDVRTAYPLGGVQGDYVLVGGVAYYWNVFEQEWFTEESTITIPTNEIKELNNLGDDFTNIEDVYKRFPNGGNEGDYLFIGGTKYVWNKWEQIWQSKGDVVPIAPPKRIKDLGTFDSLQAVWDKFPDGGSVGDYLTINSVIYDWDNYNQIWISEQGTAEQLKLLDKENVGIYDDIVDVLMRFPNGGNEGDYLFIGGIKYRWNKYTKVWVGVEECPTAGRTLTNFDGDVTIENNLTVGGILRAKGIVSKYDRMFQQALQSNEAFKKAIELLIKQYQEARTKDKQDVVVDVTKSLQAFKESLYKVFLRKDIADTALGYITFDKGFRSSSNVILDKGFTTRNNKIGIDGSGNAILNTAQLLGFEKSLKGFGVWLDDNGRAHGQIDFLHVFGKAIFNTVEIRELSHVGGDIGLSKASGKIIKVVKVEKGWKCYLKTDDGTIFTFNGWKCGDQAKCQTFNLRKGITNNAANRYYWRCVEEVAEKTDTEEAYIVLSNVEHFFDPMGTDEPREGDTLVLCGHNRTWDLTHGITESDTSRMNFTQITTSKEEGGTIEVYRNIQDFKMTLGNAIFHLSSQKLYVNTNSLVWLSGGGEQVANMLFRGDWYKGVVAYKNEVWYSKGEGWLSLTDNNTDEPSASSPNWQCRIQKGKDGGTGLRVEGFSSAGSAAYTEGQTSWKATFELHVWENDVEITTSLPSTRFVWERVSEYPEGDIAWNNRHSSDGNKINVTYDDLMGDTSFICKFLSVNGKKVITSRTF